MPDTQIVRLSCNSELVDPIAEVLATYGAGPVRIDVDGGTGQPCVSASVTEAALRERILAAVRLIERSVPAGTASGGAVGQVLRAGQFVVNPPARHPCLYPIQIQIGRAFGTGWHPATRLCLDALGHYVNPGVRVLDVGCGSGILSVAAALLDAGHVVAVDTAPAAVVATRETARTNGVGARIEVLAGSLPLPRRDSFHIVVANISATVITTIAPHVSELVDQGGLFVAAGFLEEQSAGVRRSLEEVGFTAFIQTSFVGWRRLDAFKW